MFEQCQSLYASDIQFWLNDQYTAIEPQLLQYPPNLLLTEGYPLFEVQEHQEGSHQPQQQFYYTHVQQQQQQQPQQDLFYIDDFDYFYTTEDCMVSNHSSDASSPSCSTYVSSPERELERYQISSDSAIPMHEPEINKTVLNNDTQNTVVTPVGHSKRAHSTSKTTVNNHNQFCHQTLILTPSSQESKPFACHICPRKFARKHDLQRHIRVHTFAKPYSCLNCSKSFARTDALKRHLRMEENCRQSPIIQAMKEKGSRRYRNL